MKYVLLLALLVAGCDRPAAPGKDDAAGARLERAAQAAGLVPDPTRGTILGSWSRDTDRVCVVPGQGSAYRIGAVVDYGEGQICAAAGTATRSGARVDILFGKCRINATFDGDRLVFPAELPSDCDRACVGRASLAALTVDHVSESVSEASTLRSPAGQALCGG